jgi:hypothetical protein
MAPCGQWSVTWRLVNQIGEGRDIAAHLTALAPT